MMRVSFSRRDLYMILGLAAGLVLLFEYGKLTPNRGALLLTLVFWSALAQGCIALAAAAELTGARWIASLRRELLCVHPMLLLLAVLFFCLGLRLDLYPWSEKPGLWLNGPFFMGRNLLLLLAVWWTGRRFARSSAARSQACRQDAVFYLFAFVACQSLLAFDLVMSLAYPWMSSLLGAYFFVEALYAGVALAALLFFLLRAAEQRRSPAQFGSYQRDVARLLFGFSVLWGGLFFAQYLLLWYGNLPEETGFIVERLRSPGLRNLALLVIFACFLAPFAGLMARRVKESAALVALAAVAVLAGLFGERLFFILPEAPLHLGVALFQSLVLGMVWLILVHSQGELLPEETEKAG
ncbi:hypothetical protein [Geoalkalibacter sp.]|uniref:hypothetical protein n=1 Tax=Geoalkalibacter sp. TaxID=3041440 RepID=UPI00272E0DE3|nr:hypothetical protein [Geoalkalibacter sp.]